MTVAVRPVDAPDAGSAAPAAKREPGAPAPGFDEVSEALDRACKAKEPPEETNVAMKQAEAAYVQCLRNEASKAKNALVASLPLNDPAASRLDAFDAAFTKLAEHVCWVTEEVQWVDFEDGTRDDGTLRGFAWLSCQSRAEIERAYFYRALAAKDAAGYARHLEAALPRGRRESFFLNDVATKARALKAKPAPRGDAPHASPEALGAAERREYAARFDAIARGAPRLAAETCAIFPRLAHTIGTETACVHEATAAYLAIGTFEAGGEDVGP